MRKLSRSLWTLGIPALFLGGAVSSGCGLVSKAFEGNANFDFKIDDAAATYNKVEVFNPNSDADVRNNRDKLKSGHIRQITLEITDIQESNRAKYVQGQVDVKRSVEPDDKYIMAAGKWDGIPLYDEDPAKPECARAYACKATNQIITLDLPVSTLAALRNLVFSQVSDDRYDCTPCKDRGPDGAASSGSCPKTCLDFRINGRGYDFTLDGAGQPLLQATGPVRISGQVHVKLRVIAGA